MKNKLLFLDSLRGIAALYVVIGHARWLLWEGYSSGFILHEAQYNTLQKGLVYFMALFKYGHEAVLFFFVLSGFVIHLNYINKLGYVQNLKNNLVSFYFKRFKRIYPVLLFALLFTYFCDLGVSLIYPKMVTGSTLYSTINNYISFDHGLAAMAGGILNLGRLGLPIYGSNGPLWSLAFEWWFYILYPILYIRIGKKSIVFYSVVFTGAYVGTYFFPQFLFFKSIFVGLASWCVGCILAEVYLKRIRLGLEKIVLIFSMVTILYYYFPIFGRDFLIALCFGIFLGLSLKFEAFFNKISKIKWLGDISYTLYIIHFPLLVLLSSILMNFRSGYLPMHFGYALIGILLSLLLAYFISPFFEIEVPRKLEKLKKKYFEGKELKRSLSNIKKLNFFSRK